MSDYIDFIDSNGNEWTRTTRFREARETIAAQAAVIERLTSIVKICSPLAAYGRVGTRDVEQAKFQKAINEALSIPTDSTQILDEVRKQEREKCIYVINAQKNPITTSYANGLVFDPANNMVDKCAAAIRAMG